jgi:hypothetical protein
VEAAVSHYLSVEIGNNKLESVFQRLPLSTVNGGKIDFLKTLDLLKEHRGFIINTPCGLCRSSDVLRTIGQENLEQVRLFDFDFDALRSLPQGSSQSCSPE